MSLLQLACLAAVMAARVVGHHESRLAGATEHWVIPAGSTCTGPLEPVPSQCSAALRRLQRTARRAQRQIMVAVTDRSSGRCGWAAISWSRTREAGDDPRYRELIRQWGANADMRMFLQLQAQAAVGLILAVSVALAAHSRAAQSRFAGFPGIRLLLVGALAGEAVSDWQLRRFRSDPANRRAHMRSRTMEQVTPSELLLRVALLVGLSADRNRCFRGQPAGMDQRRGSRLHVLGTGARFRYSAARSTTCCGRRGEQFRVLQARTRAFFPFPKG